MLRSNFILSTALIAAATFALTACGDTTENGANGPTNPTNTTDPDATDTDTNVTDLPAGSPCSAPMQCAGDLSCVGDGAGTFVCGTPNTGGLPTGSTCTAAAECELNSCVDGICQEPDDPTGPGVLVGSGSQCNWIDSPESCLDWNCLYEGDKTVCQHNDQGVPNSGFNWECVDDSSSDQTICTTEGMVPDTDSDWDCNYSGGSNTTTCINTADYPDPNTPGNNGGGGDVDWNCEFLESGGGKAKVCERDGGGPSATCPAGNIRGLACTPSDVSVSGATVTIDYVDCNGTPQTKTVESDALGYWTYGDIPVGNWNVTVEKGPYSTETTVSVTEAETTNLTEGNLRSCFDPNATKIAVVSGEYDQISTVLDDLGFEYDVYNGVQSWDGWNFLRDPSAVAGYDIIFVNCGMTPNAEFANYGGELAEIGTTMRNYVDGGGYAYFSDWAYFVVEAAFPEKVEFLGEDLTNNDVLAGEQGIHAVAVTDLELQAYTGLTTATIDLDLPYWAVATGHADDAKDYLVGDARLRDGSVVSDVDFLIDFQSGSGSAVFTSYHIHANGAVNQFFQFLALNFK